jgi:integrase
MEKQRGSGRIYQRGPVWWCQYNLDGRTYRESTKKDNPEDAQKYLSHRLKQVGAAQLGVAAFVTPKSQRLTVAQLVESLRADFRLRGKASPQNLCHLAKLETDFGTFRASQLSSDEITKYIERRKAAGDKPASINRTTQLLGQSFRFAVRNGHLTKVPFITRLSEAGNARKGFVSPADFEKICAELHPDLRDFARFSHATGMRRGEVSSLRWASVRGDTIVLDGENSKNGHGRVIPMVGPELEGILQRRRAARKITVDGVTQISEFIFSRVEQGKVVPIKYCWKAWQGAAKRAGFAGVLWHDLRRCAVRNLILAGVPQATAKMISGHRSDSLFSRYNIIVESQVADALTAAEIYREAKRKETQGNVVSMGGR